MSQSESESRGKRLPSTNIHGSESQSTAIPAIPVGYGTPSGHRYSSMHGISSRSFNFRCMPGFEQYFPPYALDPGPMMGMFQVSLVPMGSPLGIQSGNSQRSDALSSHGFRPSTNQSSGSRSTISSKEDADAVSSPRKRMKSKVDERKRKDSQSGKEVLNKFWDQQHDDILIPFLANQARQGMKCYKAFKRQAFKAAAIEVNNKFGENFTTENVINHMKSLKTRYLDMCKCLDISGASWDEENQMITLDPTSYKREKETNSKIEQYVNKPIKHFKNLKIIIGDDLTTGSFRKVLYEQFDQIPVAAEGFNECAQTSSQHGVNLDSLKMKSHRSTPSAGPMKGSESGASSRATLRTKKATKSKNVDEEFMGKMLDWVKEVANTIQNAHIMHWTEKLSKCIYSHSEFPEMALDKVLESLVHNETEGRIFIARPPSSQKRWLNEFMQSQGLAHESPPMERETANEGTNDDTDDEFVDL